MFLADSHGVSEPAEAPPLAARRLATEAGPRRLARNINSLLPVASATTFPPISFTPIGVDRAC